MPKPSVPATGSAAAPNVGDLTGLLDSFKPPAGEEIPPETTPEAAATTRPDLTPPAVKPTPPATESNPSSASPPAPAPAPAEPDAFPTAADFQTAVTKATNSLAKINAATTATREERQDMFTEMYQAGCEMGRTITYLSPSDSDLAEQVKTMQSFLETLAGQSGKLSAIRFLASKNLPQRKAGEGIFVVGTVKDFQAVGSMFQCTLNAGTGMEEVPVVSLDSPQQFCKIGDELVVIGRIVDDPQAKLPGYQGKQQRVILLGYQAVAPAKAP
jgi:hypothetical protein